MHYYLSLAGGSNCKAELSNSGESLYLSEGLPGLQLRKKKLGKSYNEEGYPAKRDGAGGESPFKKCKAPYF